MLFRKGWQIALMVEDIESVAIEKGDLHADFLQSLLVTLICETQVPHEIDRFAFLARFPVADAGIR